MIEQTLENLLIRYMLQSQESSNAMAKRAHNKYLFKRLYEYMDIESYHISESCRKYYKEVRGLRK